MPNAAFSRPLTPSPALAAVIGPEPRPRTKIVQDVWAYIKAQKLQGTSDKRIIAADERLKPVFGKDSTTMFELNKLLSSHLS